MNNLAELLQQWLHEPDRLLYRQYTAGSWCDYSVADTVALVARWQAGYSAAGLQPGDRVAICMHNGIQWVAADLAAHGLGLVVVPLYVDDNPENLAWCLQDSGAKLLLTNHLRFLPKLLQTLAELPQIVVARGDPIAPSISLEQWLPEQGQNARAFQINSRQAEQLATIVYTSGTLGRPKGVMLSHRNILSNVQGILDAWEIYGADRLLSVLPLSHMFERTGGYYLPLRTGAQVVYCRGISELAQDMLEQQPTVIMAVPRLFERMLARIDERLAKTPVKRWLLHQAAMAGWRRFKGQQRWFDRIIVALWYDHSARQMQQRLGGHIRQAVLGGAALDERVAKFFIGLGVPLLQGYGLTEASPVVAVNREASNDPASVGEPLSGFEVKLNGQSELLVRGPGVMLGYWNNPQATQQMIDSAGWLNTGDIVEIRDKRIYIRGRSKNILVLSNGEKIAPEDVEKAVLADPAFQQVMLIGEAKPCLVLLVVSAEKDERALLKRANAQIGHLPRHARIRRIILSSEEWTSGNGLLTPTLKIKREAVYQLHLSNIEEVYREITG